MHYLVSDVIDDYDLLSPNNFLIGYKTSNNLYFQFSENPTAYRKQWK